MAAQTLELRYIFVAQFNDGTEYVQNEEDVSSRNKKRSCYSDLCVWPKGQKDPTIGPDGLTIIRDDIRAFQLEGPNNSIYTVDLLDGHFEVNHAPFIVPGELIPDEAKPAKLKLVYFRRRQQHQRVQLELVAEDKAGKVLGTKTTFIGEPTQNCAYHFGWSFEFEGKKYERTIVVI